MGKSVDYENGKSYIFTVYIVYLSYYLLSDDEKELFKLTTKGCEGLQEGDRIECIYRKEKREPHLSFVKIHSKAPKQSLFKPKKDKKTDTTSRIVVEKLQNNPKKSFGLYPKQCKTTKKKVVRLSTNVQTKLVSHSSKNVKKKQKHIVGKAVVYRDPSLGFFSSELYDKIYGKENYGLSDD